MNCPTPYNFDQYVAWHNQIVEPDMNIIDELTILMNSLKQNRDRFEKLAQLLDHLNTILLRAKRTADVDVSSYKCEILLDTQLSTGKYDDIFKSTTSIIDKLWRKNRNTTNYVKTTNIKENIKDLARSSVILSTHKFANDFSKALPNWREKLEWNHVALDDFSNIIEIKVEQEAKMASGYFAYHADVIYDDGFHVEIQIYSQLNEVWRGLSHKLYEKTRLQQDVEYGHGTSASRLVSLGHLLHLAECEAERLQKELE
ncbi:hypothetical protein JRC10_25425 [Escherichia coli]|uniref:hypothetical protein n=1 Tax=Escherichia TaxID=561 RepID=UPI000BFA696B|nr:MULTISPECIES: hypothetical protein [Escherichia]EKK2592977.1 hypothetical protein [Escherichia coli O110]EET5293092.1 hypothetical protein [Escherichia coli]EEV6013909.1 hypothetical protein [Escherichia coli]EEY3664579.1 hypothetical protein [Escherichia coli]EEZ8001538.1 hypothetical protein [Escherichia coli]